MYENLDRILAALGIVLFGTLLCWIVGSHFL
jgi:hypothetical protein